MDDSDGLRVDSQLNEHFEGSPFDESASMLCPSFDCSSSSTSRRNSIHSQSFDQSFDIATGGLSFPQHSLMDIDGFPGLPEDNIDLGSEQFRSTEKLNRQWSPGSMTLHPPVLQQPQDLLLSIDFRYEEQPPEQSQFDACTIGSFLGVSTIGPQDMLDNGTSSGQPTTIVPSMTFCGVALQHDLGVWEPRQRRGCSAASDELDTQISDDKADCWDLEVPLYNSPTSSASLPQRAPRPSPQASQNDHCTMKLRRGGHKSRIRGGTSMQSASTHLQPKPTNICDLSVHGKLCGKSFQRPEHLARHKKSAAHNDNRDWACPHPECLEHKVAFNRRDNYKAHVVNCHLVESDKPRRNRVHDSCQIEKLGWSRFLPQRDKEIEKRKRKQGGREATRYSTHLAYRSRKRRSGKEP